MIIVWPYGAKNQNAQQVGGSVWAWSTGPFIVIATPSEGFKAPGGHMAYKAGGHMAHEADPQHQGYKTPKY